ncbi:MAG: aldehyde dehydrogenase family protein, partial [Mycobacterium sp.]
MTSVTVDVTPMLVDGCATFASNGSSIPVYEPASGRLLSRVPRGGQVEISQATAAARRALPGWRAQAASVRGRALCRVADELEAELE